MGKARQVLCSDESESMKLPFLTQNICFTFFSVNYLHSENFVRCFEGLDFRWMAAGVDIIKYAS